MSAGPPSGIIYVYFLEISSEAGTALDWSQGLHETMLPDEQRPKSDKQLSFMRNFSGGAYDHTRDGSLHSKLDLIYLDPTTKDSVQT
jgi:hypothetical protein